MRECNYGACDPLDHGELEKSLRGKVHALPGISGYHHQHRQGVTAMTTECPNCMERPSKRQVCACDGKYHHHGCVHMIDGRLERLCDECMDADRKAWAARPGHWSNPATVSTR